MLTSDPLSWLEGVRDSAEAILGDRFSKVVAAGRAVLHAGCVDAARVRLVVARVAGGIGKSTMIYFLNRGFGGQKGDGGMRESDVIWRFCSTMSDHRVRVHRRLIQPASRPVSHRHTWIYIPRPHN